MYNLTFDFSVEKLVEAIAFFSVSGVPDLTKLKVAKLLYYADKTHLLSYGQPILGDVYYCMDWGPVPSLALNEMNAAISRPEVPPMDGADSSLFERVLNVKRLFYWYHPRFQAREGAYDFSVFQESELQALGDTVEKYGNLTAKQLVDLTHKEPTWRIPNANRASGGRAPISYDLFFEGAPATSQRFLAKLVADQLGHVVPLAGDTDYAAFASELAGYQNESEISESDIRSRSRYSRV